MKLELRIVHTGMNDKYHWTLTERECDEDVDQFYVLSRGNWTLQSKALAEGLAWTRKYGFNDLTIVEDK